ncbi:MAG: S8 family serine peptidase, partial [Candidatus Hydrogenedentes bacterium]|nr:S8 family serine peptidase [Candidatus Hydrogenedentota bacterium]
LQQPIQAYNSTDWSSDASLDHLRDIVWKYEDAVLAILPQTEFILTHQYENFAGFSGYVTPAGLQQLAQLSDVWAIEPVRLLEEHLAQGIPLLNGSTYRPFYNGQDLAVAICDTGVDYTHAMLGGGSFPNGKVIGGYDFGDNDADPMAGGAHGTACAGLAAGTLGTSGDYIGGVGYSAKIYALKISPGATGSATTAAMISAWDWCVTHRNDNASYPLKVISTSFGGGQYFSSCDATSSGMTTAALNAVNAGITVLASSGNDGFCDSIAWPACISYVISVGAVYDANFGTYYPCLNALSCAPKTAGGCSTGYFGTDATAADKVTSYSNTASFLGILAPSNAAYTLDIAGSGGYSSGDYYSSFGGTSAACPYAAGAVLALQSANMAINGSYLTPAQVLSTLTSTGDSILDTKVAISKPRVNLGAAIDSIGGAPPGSNDDCSSPDVLLPGGSVSANTVLATNSFTGLCATNDGKDVFYSFTPLVSDTYTFSLCGSSFDTTLSVLSNNCGSPAMIACNDDFCGLQSQVSTALTWGNTYLIRVAGFNGASGSFTLTVDGDPPGLSCASTSHFSQPPMNPSTGGWNAYRSDSASAHAMYENFSGLTNKIETLRWWGIEFNTGGCDRGSLTFDVTVHVNSGGVPGAPFAATESVTAVRSDTGHSFTGGTTPAPLYQYDAVLSSPISRSTGWISIRATGSSGGCYFYWALANAPGNGSYQSPGGAAPSDVALCISGDPLPISVTPASRDSGTVNLGSCTTRAFKVTNTGAGTLTGSASVSAPFSISSGGSYSLANGQSQWVYVNFCPTATGAANKTVAFTGGGGATATVTGAGGSPLISVSPAARDFGLVSLGSCVTRAFKVTNIGTGTLTGTASVPAPFAATTNASYSLTAGQSVWVSMDFCPTAGGPFGKTVTFSGGGGATATVTGKGNAPAIGVSPASRSFGAVAVGSCATRAFLVTNVGTGTLIGTASVPLPFTATTNAAYSLTAGQSMWVSVEFCPAATGARNRTVTFSGGARATTTVTGTGS